MRDAIERMYASGELDRMLRWCGVREADIADMRQEVAEILLTTRSQVSNLHQYTFSVINRQYKSRKSRWWRKYGRWDARCSRLQDLNREIPADDGLGDLGGGQPLAEDVPCAANTHAQRADNFPAGAGAWHNSGDRKAVKSTPQHHSQALPQNTKKDTK